jgi:hypothetical protein
MLRVTCMVISSVSCNSTTALGPKSHSLIVLLRRWHWHRLSRRRRGIRRAAVGPPAS